MRILGRPVGLIRSPTVAMEVSVRVRTPCQPHRRQSLSGFCRGGPSQPSSRARRARMWSGVVPQQPPRMDAPLRRKSRAQRANSSGPTSYTVSPPSMRGRPALGWTATGRWVARSISSRAGPSSRGPTEQLSPTPSAPRAVRVTAAAAGSTPKKVLPSAPKVMVASTGRRVFSFAASRAALASSRSPMVSMSTRSAPACSPAVTISAKSS